MLLPVEKVFAIRQSEDGLNAPISPPSNNKFIFCLDVCVYHYVSVFDSLILVIVIVIISVLTRRILLHVYALLMFSVHRL